MVACRVKDALCMNDQFSFVGQFMDKSKLTPQDFHMAAIEMGGLSCSVVVCDQI